MKGFVWGGALSVHPRKQVLDLKTTGTEAEGKQDQGNCISASGLRFKKPPATTKNLQTYVSGKITAGDFTEKGCREGARGVFFGSERG